MRRLAGLVVLLTLLGAAPPAWGAIAHVQVVSCVAAAASTCTTAPAVMTTSGNLLVATAGYCCAAFTSITDSKSNTYATAVAELSSGSARLRQLYKENATGGASHTFTLTGSTGSFYGTLSVSEISGAATSGALDQTATGTDTGSSTSHTTAATATTAQANELLLGAGSSSANGNYGTDTGAGWTERTNISTSGSAEGLLTGTRIVSATGTYAYTFTSSASMAMTQLISTWKEATAAAGVRQQCIGCGADRKVME